MGLIGSIGAGKAAQAQAQAMKKIAEGYGKLGKKQYEWISPWMDAGKGALTTQMQMLANPLNSQAALSDYYAGPQYAMQEEQAQYALNSAAEATGTTGATATGNALASQSVSLGQNYLNSLNKQRSQQFQQLGGISNQGLGATKTMGNWAYQDYNSAANVLGQAAGLQGQADMAPYAGADAFLNKQMGMAMQGFGLMASAGML
ncbi:hypothetical protein [Enterobacter hormaechei]|uniref:hypothetical protein n=1 Tax=Enterobacter hormaechei TaxID=158836 RepID=UPI0034D20BA2